MKKFCTLLLNILLFVSSACAEIIYREAKSNDISGILSLYENMPQESKKNLFLFPTLELQKKAILKNIEKKRLVIALDGLNIIGFAKNFFAFEEELEEILHDELAIIKNETTLEQCLAYKTYEITKKQNSFELFQPTEQSTDNLVVLNSCLKQKKSSIFIYTGGYYTHPNYRGKGINTQLCLYQLESIFKTIKEKMKKEKITYIALLYGQVLANTKHVGMVREFATCLQSTLISNFTLHHYLFKATKPELQEINGELKIVFLSENEGRGNIVITKMVEKERSLDVLF